RCLAMRLPRFKGQTPYLGRTREASSVRQQVNRVTRGCAADAPVAAGGCHTPGAPARSGSGAEQLPDPLDGAGQIGDRALDGTAHAAEDEAAVDDGSTRDVLERRGVRGALELVGGQLLVDVPFATHP